MQVVNWCVCMRRQLSFCGCDQVLIRALLQEPKVDADTTTTTIQVSALKVDDDALWADSQVQEDHQGQEDHASVDQAHEQL